MNEMTMGRDDAEQIGHGRALPGWVLNDTAMFARLRDTVFFRSWQLACHQSRIPEAGDYFAFSIFDQDLFVIRQKDGSVRGFYNVCQHRGHQLVEDSGRARLLVCPYHA